jgi:glycosyltransferase involved in cell wall biosynthesis
VHVGLNLVYLVPGETGGMEVYARELIPALAAVPDLRVTAFVNREAAAAGDGPWGDVVSSVVVPVNARNRAAWVAGEQYHLPRLAARVGVDLVHSLASTGPARGSFARVVTIHDLIYRVHADAHFGVRSLGMRLLVPLAAKRSDRIVVDAESTRADVVSHLGVDPSRIDVIPLGLGSTPRATPVPEGELRARLGLGDRPIVLSVSAKRPHKNLARLLEALVLIPADDRPTLVLPGYSTPHEDELRALAEERGIGERVRFLDWVAANELEGLYAAATAFVFPSLYEGFGLPVLEAMARGVPVASSNASSLPEVAGDAAILFEPTDAGAIADALRAILTSPDERARLRAAGLRRAEGFSWERTAAATVESYRRALSAS